MACCCRAKEEMDEDVEEGAPLLNDADTLAKECADEDMFPCPKPWYLCLLCSGMAGLNVLTVIGAFSFVCAAHDEVLADCSAYGSTPKAFCMGSVFAFWTLPLLCGSIALFMFAKNMLDMRLYYECLMHHICLDFENDMFLNSTIVRLLLLYTLEALSMLFFLDKPQTKVFGILAYLAPIVSFYCYLYSNWSVEDHLVALAKFLEKDLHWAREHLENSQLVSQKYMSLAFFRLKEKLDKDQKETGKPKELTTSQFLGLLGKDSFKLEQIKADIPDRFSGWWYSAKQGYWVKRLLLCKYWQDTRSWSFYYWYLAYHVLATILHTLLFLLFVGAVLSWAFHVGLLTEHSHPYLLKFDLTGRTHHGPAMFFQTHHFY